MLTLALLRHAKSSWDDSCLNDFDRPLNARGQQAAPLMGTEMAQLGLAPGLILCSPSRRTRDTLKYVLPHLKGAPASVRFDEALYLAGAADLLRLIRDQQSPATTLLLVGHNPGLHILATTLAGTGQPHDMARLEEKFPTASLAVFSFPQTRWRDIGPGLVGKGLVGKGLGGKGLGHLEAFITPKGRA